MSIYDKSSLVLIPSGTKTGKVFSQKPVSGDGDFTFTRASAATRVNADGNIEKETQNLITYSNTFDVSWSNGGTLTSGQAGYDGSNDAWLFETTASGQYIAKGQSVSGVQTFSLYAKAGSTDGVALRIIGGTNPYFYYDLNNGIVVGGGGSASKIATDITSVGNGWYRCSLSIAETSSSVRIYCATSGGDFAAGNILIQDAQLEQGLVARDVLTTTTSAVEGGITDNVPRLDYTDSSCPALLLEPQRTNLLENSEYILGGDWNQLGGALSIAQNTTDTLSPEGKYNSAAITLSSTANRYFSSQGYNLGGLTAVSASVWLKTNGGELQGALAFFNGTGGDAITITEEWQRFEINKTASNSTEYLGLDFRGSYSQSGIVYCYGWQFENNASYATSYIPTYGSSVSRVQDYNSATNTSNLIGQTEGTLFVEFDHYQLATSNFQRNFVLAPTGSDSANRISIIPHTSNNNKFYITIRYASTNIEYVATTSSGNLKIAIGYKSGDSAIYVNGTQVFSSVTSFAFTETLNRFSMDSSDLVKQALLFKTRLSNEELAALTTI